MFDYNIYEDGVRIKTWKEDLLQKTPMSDLMWSTITVLLCFVGMTTCLIWKYWTPLQRVYASTRKSIKSGSDKVTSMYTAVQTYLAPVWPWIRPLVDFLYRILSALLEYIRYNVVTLLGGEIHGAPPETTFVNTSAQGNTVRAELTDANAAKALLREKLIAANTANALLQDELTTANAANASLRDELAAVNKPVEDFPQLPRYEPRLSLGGYKAKSLFQRAPRYPGICVPTLLSEMKDSTAELVSNSVQTVAVKPTYVYAATAISPEIGTVGQPQQSLKSDPTALSYSPITAVQIRPERQQSIPTKSAALSFSSIKAVHRIVPEPVHQRPATRTIDAGVQADSTDLVSREELNTQAERHASEIAALMSSHLSNEQKQLEHLQERHDTEIARVHSSYTSEITAFRTTQGELKARIERHESEIAALTLSHSIEIANLKSSTEEKVKVQSKRHDSEITALKSSHLSDRREQLRAQKERHDTEIADVRSAYSTEITNLKSSQSPDVVAAQEKLALYEQEGIKLQATVNSISSSYAAMEARVQSRDNENARLSTELEAAKAKVAAGASQQEVEEYVKNLQRECANQLAVKDDNCGRKLKALKDHLERSEADRKKAEADARVVPGLRHQISRLEGKVNKGTWPGLTTPSNGSMKNSAALRAELKQAEFDRDENRRCWKRDSDKMKVFEQEKLAAMAEVGKLETDNARYLEALGIGARTIVAAPTVNAAAGNKRGAEDQMSSGVGKRAR